MLLDCYGVLRGALLGYIWCAFGLLGTLGVLLSYFWTTYSNTFALSCIEFILGMEVPKVREINHLPDCYGN